MTLPILVCLLRLLHIPTHIEPGIPNSTRPFLGFLKQEFRWNVVRSMPRAH
jgi:hypothetical protein